MQDGHPLFNIERTLKGPVHDSLYVKSRSWYTEVPAARFKDGETVLLFLESPDPNGTACLVAVGEQGKWPKKFPPDSNEPYRRPYPRIQAAASLEEIEQLVRKMVAMDEAADLEMQVRLCEEYLGSGDPLLQYTAMQYGFLEVLSPAPRERQPRVSREVARRRRGIRKRLSGSALPLVDSNEPDVCGWAARALQYAHPYIAMPKLIAKIADEEQVVRDGVKTALNGLGSDLKIEGSFRKYNTRDSVEKLESVRQQWSDWWEANKDRIKSTMGEAARLTNAAIQTDEPARTEDSNAPAVTSQDTDGEGPGLASWLVPTACAGAGIVLIGLVLLVWKSKK